jgi:hypothetical protein
LMFIRIVSAVVGVVALAWLTLLFSSRAILVSEKVEQAMLRERLVCVYFNGSRTMRKEYWYSKNDVMGRAACPRWEHVRLVEE